MYVFTPSNPSDSSTPTSSFIGNFVLEAGTVRGLPLGKVRRALKRQLRDWHWQPGDIVVWDNRCTLHAASGFDHENESREILPLEIGRFNPYLGTSYTELSAESRSMHKSQGFGLH